MKKIFLTPFVFLFLFTNISLTRADTVWPGGSGLEGDPFQIENCEQLQSVSSSSAQNYHFILNNDIDCSMTNPSSSNWDVDGIWGNRNGFVPIGNGSRLPFVGVFNGNHKKINNLYINPVVEYSSPVDSFGLFGYISDYSEIKDVGLVNVNITGIGKVGGLVGSSGSNTVIRNSYVTGLINGTNSGNVDSSAFGGLVGINQSHIENSYSSVVINGENNTGGLVGKSLPGILPVHTILNSYSNSTVTGTTNVGGLVGLNEGDLIKNSFSTGSVTGTTNVGGLVGYLIYDSGVCSDYISNSGWFKNNESLNSIGLIEGGLICDNIFMETNKNVFYSKNHAVYAKGQSEAWDFLSPVWFEWNDRLPLFEKQPQQKVRSRSSSGSSPSVMIAFQNEQKLKETLIDPNSPSKIKLNPPANLTRIIRKTSPRTTGEDVANFQSYLNSIGYNAGVVDGVYGTKTHQAVLFFQIDNKLPTDGSIGPITFGVMK